jgi:hypothetical protein
MMMKKCAIVAIIAFLWSMFGFGCHSKSYNSYLSDNIGLMFLYPDAWQLRIDKSQHGAEGIKVFDQHGDQTVYIVLRRVAHDETTMMNYVNERIDNLISGNGKIKTESTKAELVSIGGTLQARGSVVVTSTTPVFATFDVSLIVIDVGGGELGFMEISSFSWQTSELHDQIALLADSFNEFDSVPNRNR